MKNKFFLNLIVLAGAAYVSAANFETLIKQHQKATAPKFPVVPAKDVSVLQEAAQTGMPCSHL